MVQRAIGVLCTDMGYRILPPKQDSGWFCNTLLLLSKIDHGIRIYTRLAKRLIRTGLVTMITPARTLSISGLKSRVLKLPFFNLKMMMKKWSRFFFF